MIIWEKFVFCLRPLRCMIFLNTFFVRIWGLIKLNVRTEFKITWPSEARHNEIVTKQLFLTQY